ncbi:helix-turn-helix domain-containing protein [Streptomyces sp. Tue6028]|uniref:PucR family transcriptional regulator n=1 Tax=Streptomyces sp. Tue6028 TaxID=2036037 RepID=UPI003D73AAEE
MTTTGRAAARAGPGTGGEPRGGPWVSLPRRLGAELQKENRTVAAEIIHEIRSQIPEFSRPLSGQFGASIQQGVETALAEFADRVTAAGGPLEAARTPVYRALGRGELVEGRSLDALQAAYRLGARVAWRRYARVARRLALGTEAVALLADAVFTHIDEIAAVSVQAYADAQADAAGTAGRRRHRLLILLTGGSGPDLETLRRAAAEADWPLPDTVAAVALGPMSEPGRGTAPATVAPRSGAGAWGTTVPSRAASASSDGPSTSFRRHRLPEPVLADLEGTSPCLVVPTPHLLFADPRLQHLLRETGAVVGPAVPPSQAADSLRWARTLRAAGAVPAPGAAPVTAPSLTELLLLADPALVRLMAARRLEPLASLTAKQRDRLASTLLACLQTPHGTAPEIAARLGIHPQTARQRLHQVHRLFGDALADPDARFEIEAALRAVLGNGAPDPDGS